LKDAGGIEAERGGRDATRAVQDPTEDHVLIGPIVRKVVVRDQEDLEMELDLDKVPAKAVDPGELVQTQASAAEIAVIAGAHAMSVTAVRSRLPSPYSKDGSFSWFQNSRLSRALPSRSVPASKPTPSSNSPA
jgi:hypothetical protein